MFDNFTGVLQADAVHSNTGQLYCLFGWSKVLKLNDAFSFDGISRIEVQFCLGGVLFFDFFFLVTFFFGGGGGGVGWVEAIPVTVVTLGPLDPLAI